MFRLGVINQNSPHGFGRRTKEMPAAVPVPGLIHVDQSQIRLVDQRRGLQRLPRPLLRQALGGQLAQLVIDQRQQLGSGVRVALLDGGQDARDVTHGGHRDGPGMEKPTAV